MKNVIRAWACGEHARKCQLLFATHATKEYLWEHLRQEELLEPEDLIGAIELLRANRAILRSVVSRSDVADEHSLCIMHH